MKKTLAILLALALLLAAFPAALADEEAYVYPEFTTADVKEKGPGKLSDKPITLRVFGGSNVKNQIRDNMDENLMTRWLEEKTNVHLKWELPASAEIGTKLNLSLASNAYPDMYYGVNLSTAQTLLYAEEGVLLPLNDYLEEYAPDYYKLLQENSEFAQVATAPDGNIYSFLRTDAGLHQYSIGKLFLNKEWFDNSGWDHEPATPAQLKEYLMYIKEHDMNGNGDPNDEIPLIAPINDGEAYNVLRYLMSPFQMIPYHSKLDVKDGQVYLTAATQGYKEGLAYVHDLYVNGLIDHDSFVVDGTTVKSLTSQDLVGATYTSEIRFLIDTESNTSYNYQWFAPSPLADAEGNIVTANTNNSCVPNAYVTTACEHPEVAIAWLNYWFTEEGSMLNMSGFEDITYIWTDEINYLGSNQSWAQLQALHPDLYSTITQNWWCSSGCRYQPASLRYASRVIEGSNEWSLYTSAKKYEDYIAKEYIPGTLWMSVEQAEEVGMIESTINDYIDEATAKFITGEWDIEKDWDNYLNELKAQQADRWVELYQEIMDEQGGGKLAN